MITVCGRCGGTDERPHEHCANCNPWSQVKTCCHLAKVGGTDEKAPRVHKVYISCGKDAAFEIVDLAEARPDAAFTLACEEHVGALLGHVDGTALHDGARDEWTVRALDPSEIGELGPRVA